MVRQNHSRLEKGTPHPAKEYTASDLWLIGAMVFILPALGLFLLAMTCGGLA